MGVRRGGDACNANDAIFKSCKDFYETKVKTFKCILDICKNSVYVFKFEEKYNVIMYVIQPLLYGKDWGLDKE